MISKPIGRKRHPTRNCPKSPFTQEVPANSISQQICISENWPDGRMEQVSWKCQEVIKSEEKAMFCASVEEKTSRLWIVSQFAAAAPFRKSNFEIRIDGPLPLLNPDFPSQMIQKLILWNHRRKVSVYYGQTCWKYNNVSMKKILTTLIT